MATTLFNNIILAAASRVKDARTSALATDDSGKRYSSAQWAKYLNTSVRDLLIENLQKYEIEAFSDIFPEFVKTGGTVSIVAGVFAKPSDCFTMIDLRQSSLFIRKIKSERVQQILTNRDPLIVPSATKPVFYQEGSNVYTLGVTSGDAIPRYIKTYEDIVPTTGSAGNGRIGSVTTAATWTVSTRTLAGLTMSTNFDANDVGKEIIFVDTFDGVKTYKGIIDAFNGVGSVKITGDSLPPSNILATYITNVVVVDRDLTDLTINKYWHGELINRTVAYAMKDAKDFVQ